jgi:hypothetical protein
MSSPKKILIIFPDTHLAYSPTVIQLYDFLNANNEVTILAPEPTDFNNRKVSNRHVVYYENKKIHGFVRYFYRIYFEFILWFKGEKRYKSYFDKNYNFYFFTLNVIRKHLKKNRYDRVIAVDLSSLSVCNFLKIKSDFLSLELPKEITVLKNINFDLIENVITQTPERYQYLFGEKKKNVFYVQNSPVFRDINIPNCRKNLIYCGTAWQFFGFNFCLDYLSRFANESMTVIGTVKDDAKKLIAKNYSNLVNKGRLVIDTKYYENDELVNELANYEIGFCFYNFNDSRINSFNYITAPSGKLFKYLAAGVPVVANNIIGFKFVSERQCGVLIDDLSPETINDAIMKIRNSYSFFVENAIAAAQHFSFDKSVKPYLESF